MKKGNFLILAHLVVGTGGGGAIGLTFRCGDGTIDAARLSAANLAGDGTPVLNFLQGFMSFEWLLSNFLQVHFLREDERFAPPVLKRGRLVLGLGRRTAVRGAALVDPAAVMHQRPPPHI